MRDPFYLDRPKRPLHLRRTLLVVAIGAFPFAAHAQDGPADELASAKTAATAPGASVQDQLPEYHTRLDPAQDPKFKSYVDGDWTVFPTPTQQDEGLRSCTALYTVKGGMISISGPVDSSGGAVLAFFSPDIPSAGKATTVSVALMQSGDSAPQIVMAVSQPSSVNGTGVLALSVPTVDALLDNILDTHKFRIWLDGDPVVNLNWHDGFAARDRLRDCQRAPN